MMELVRTVEQGADPRTGAYPVDVRAVKKASLVVLTQPTYRTELVAKTAANPAAKLFVDNLEGLAHKSIMDWLENVVVLRDVGQDAMSALADVAHVQAMAPGVTIIEQHQSVPKLYVVLAGELRVTCEAAATSSSAGDHEEYNVGSLKPGDFFGESSLLMDDGEGEAPMNATAKVTTGTECLFLYFDAATMRERLADLPEARNAIGDFVKRRLSAQLVAMDLPLFATLLPAALALFTADLVVRNFGEGDVVFRKDDSGDDFYVVIEGGVRIVDPDHSPPLDVTLHRKGDYFGEVALIRSEPRSATVSCIAPTSLARISGSHFREICLESPTVAAEFEIRKDARVSLGFLRARSPDAPLTNRDGRRGLSLNSPRSRDGRRGRRRRIFRGDDVRVSPRRRARHQSVRGRVPLASAHRAVSASAARLGARVRELPLLGRGPGVPRGLRRERGRPAGDRGTTLCALHHDGQRGAHQLLRTSDEAAGEVLRRRERRVAPAARSLRRRAQVPHGEFTRQHRALPQIGRVQGGVGRVGHRVRDQTTLHLPPRGQGRVVGGGACFLLARCGAILFSAFGLRLRFDFQSRQTQAPPGRAAASRPARIRSREWVVRSHLCSHGALSHAQPAVVASAEYPRRRPRRRRDPSPRTSTS